MPGAIMQPSSIRAHLYQLPMPEDKPLGYDAGCLTTADPYQCGTMAHGAILVLGWQFNQWRLIATLIPMNGDQPGDIESRAREFQASRPTTRTVLSKVL